jgi:serine O-acetyltransferase
VVARRSPAELRFHFVAAVVADARAAAAYRSERSEFRDRRDAVRQAARLAWRSDAFMAQVFYRAQSSLHARGVPILPTVAHRLAMMTAQLSIANDAVVHPGVYFPHGQVVVEAGVEIHPGVVVSPWVVITGRDRARRPSILAHTQIGTGAVITTGVRVGAGSLVGANAVVVRDVAAGQTVVGVPAAPAGSGAHNSTGV